MDIHTLANSLCDGKMCTSNTYVLKEKDRDATLNKVTICDIPENTLFIKMDPIRFNKFFIDNKEWGFNKHSDYLIVTQDRLVFIEMKSRKNVNAELEEECRKKFTSDYCTINYADNIFVDLLSKKSFFNNKEIHYVLLYQSNSIVKEDFANHQKTPNNTPETFRKIPVCNEGIISYNNVI